MTMAVIAGARERAVAMSTANAVVMAVARAAAVGMATVGTMAASREMALVMQRGWHHDGCSNDRGKSNGSSMAARETTITTQQQQNNQHPTQKPT
jgi:hypothetical protein